MLVKQPVSTLLMLEDLTNSHKYQFMIYLREFVKSWNIRIINNWGINCLSFEPTIPSKFMVGTEQGGVVVARMQAKAGTNDWILADLESCHQGKVMAVDRNPFYPKNFLTVRDAIPIFVNDNFFVLGGRHHLQDLV